MSTARMAHINRKRPRLHSGAASGSHVKGDFSQLEADSAVSTALPLPLSGTLAATAANLVQPEVIDLDSDSENYAFKDQVVLPQQAGKRPKNYSSVNSALEVADDFFSRQVPQQQPQQQQQRKRGAYCENIDEDDLADGNEFDEFYEPQDNQIIQDPELYPQQQWFKPRILSDEEAPSDGSMTSPYATHQFDGQIASPRSTSSSSSSSSTGTSSYASNSVPSRTTSQGMIGRILKRRRTRSVPQLPYTRLRYIPLADKQSVMEKVGEVATTLIPHYPMANYTYGNKHGHVQPRKFSFDYAHHEQALIEDEEDQEEESDDNDDDDSGRDHVSQDSSSSSTLEDTPCDDKDGHYIVTPGATFANGRFQIRSLLGQGTFGKVVRAYDRQNHSTVAIKIIKSIPKYREASKIELRVLAMLKKHDPTNVNQCIHLRECFDYRGHICIVTDMLNISLYDFLEKNQFLPFPGSHIQAIARQILRSVAFLHDMNLIHTDLKPENILLQDDTYVRKPFKKPRSSKVLYRRILRDPKIFTIDFGSAIFDDEYHSSVVSTRHYRAPEIVLGTGWSFPCDIWSVGCILVELLTGDALFRTHENAQHLAMMEKVVGEPIDLKLVRQSFNHFYHTNGQRRENRHSSEECIADTFSRSTGRLIFPTSSTPRKLVGEVDQLPFVADMIGSRVGFRFSPKLSLRESVTAFKVPKARRNEYKFWYFFIDLIRRMLTFDPEKRISAMEAMNHKWFKCGVMDDGLSV
ncbi:DEKNAAC101253 [Brettanomyces naardenensis]|uniref:DEKNAAC101253 n=1 Tax=Brettanomyces naardenensis TaxID=13370 RepID=A0A448YHW0_BRENA|nr:DEKNAAC101253 [Brettanomyces naardenensis]